MPEKAHAEPHSTPQPLAIPGPFVQFAINAELAALHQADTWEQTGMSRKSLVRYPDFRISLIALKAGRRIEEHHNPGRISVQPVVGHIRMQAAGRVFDLPKGQMLVLDRAVTHDVEAVGEDSAFLLTVALPEPVASR
jgi:quercetin dioxygenase-like cupin family protein